LNLKNPNSVAVDIANKTLSSICYAVGVMNPNDSEELHDRPLEVKLAVKPPRDNYDATNEVKGYRSAEATTPAPTNGKAAAAPWKR
jgi:hypothetical protein